MAQFKLAWGSHGALPPLQAFCDARRREEIPEGNAE
jgi:hypothetical protein